MNWRLSGFIFIVLGVCLFSVESIAQTKDILEKRKAESLKKLNLTKALLDETVNQREISINQLNLLSESINFRQGLINDYEEEIDYFDRLILTYQNQYDANIKVLDDLRNQYAEIIRKSYRNIERTYVLMLLFSSQDINQSYERFRYIKYLNSYRKSLFNQIVEKNDSLLQLQNEIELNRKEKEKTILMIQSETKSLKKDIKNKNFVISKLQQREKALIAEIKKNEQERIRIENEIKRIIEEERRRIARENNSAANTRNLILSKDFSGNKGKFPWPSENGIVVGKYGEHNHPVIPGIKIRSNGIDISVRENSEVKSIFDGQVTVVSAILGANFTVIIKHGDYRTVYQNVTDVRVKNGDMVERNDIIGFAGKNNEGKSTIHFELWKEFDTLDPQLWLVK